MKIVSFGDSFIWGSELENNLFGTQAWPGLIAQELGIGYSTMSNPGCGNDEISRQVLTYFSNNTATDTLAVINWTWAFRWDFYIINTESWVTLGPSCIPSRLGSHLQPDDAKELINVYNKYAGKSMHWNKWRALQTIYSTQCYLNQLGVRNIQTYMDTFLFDREFHAPDYVVALQNIVGKDMQLFENMNFLDWSRSKGFAVTEPGWHPLEDAHAAAKDLWIERYKAALNK